MSIHDKLVAVANELHLTGFGAELNEALTRLVGTIADHVHEVEQKVGGVAAGDIKPIEDKVAALVEAKLKDLGPAIEQHIAGLLAPAKAQYEAAMGQVNAIVEQLKALQGSPAPQSPAPAAAPDPRLPLAELAAAPAAPAAPSGPAPDITAAQPAAAPAEAAPAPAPGVAGAA